MGVVIKVRYVGPAEVNWFDLVQARFAYIEDSAALRAEHPFMPVRGQRVDSGRLNVERKRPQALNCIDEEEAAVRSAYGPEPDQVSALSSKVLNKRNSE